MIVLDASVVVDLLLAIDPVAADIERRILDDPDGPVMPELADAEVGQVLRRYVLRRELSAARARTALRDLRDLAVPRYPLSPLCERAFDLRKNATFYDAIYLVLAESLSASLITRDAALKKIPGCDAKVVVL